MYYRTVLQQCTRGYRRTTTTSTTATTANSSASSQSHVVGQKKEYARSLIPLIAAVQMHRVDNMDHTHGRHCLKLLRFCRRQMLAFLPINPRCALNTPSRPIIWHHYMI